MADWIETFKGAVLASEYDAETHMNSHIYVTRFDQATWFLLQAVGVTPATAKASGRRVAVLRQNYQYVRDLRGGDLVSIRSGFVAVSEKHLRFQHRMTDHASGALIASADNTASLAFADTGKSAPLPPEVRRLAEKLLVTTNVAKATGLD
jgi:acyl-CoA thioesterase FadM